MRHRPIQAAPRERVPFTLWGRKPVRQVLATVAASAVALVPVTFIASPAYAAVIPNLTITPAANWEGGDLAFKVTYTGAAASPAITFTGVDNASPSAVDTEDYTATPTDNATYTFPGTTAGGTNSITVTIATTTAGAPGEGDQTFLLSATGGGNTTEAVGTIWDLPVSAPRLDVSAPATVAESAGTAAIVASIASPLDHDVTIPVSAAGTLDNGAGTAALSSGGVTRDFTAPVADAAITIQAGTTTGALSLAINDDNVDEPETQYVRVTIGATVPTGVTTNGTMTADIGITDNDAAPTVSIGDAAAVNEGTAASFPIRLSGLSENALTVDFTTSNGSDTDKTRGATGGTSSTGDFTAVTAPVSVPIPPMTQTVYQSVTTRADVLTPPYGDDVLEGTETFNGSISNPSTGLTLGTPLTATATINDRDTTPSVAVTDMDLTNNIPTPTTDVFFDEGSNTTTNAEIAVSIALGATARETPLRLDYTFTDVTATNGVDYTGTAGSLTIPVTATGTWTGKIPVKIVGDTTYEGTAYGLGRAESFTVTLASANKTVGGLGSQTVYVVEGADDAQPTWTTSDVSVVEGNEGQTMARVPINLSGAAGADVLFTTDFTGLASATETGVNSGATVGANDYDIPATRTVTIKKGDKSGYLDIPINGDAVYERDEAFSVALATVSTSVNSTLTADVSHTARVNITNDDAKPTVKLTEVSGGEGTTMRVVGTLVGLSQYNYTLGVTTAAIGTNAATPGTDYEVPTTLATRTIPVAQGDTALSEANSRLAEFYLLPDDIDEATETFGVTVSEVTASPQGFSTATGTFRITDDPADLPPAAAIRDESIGEWEGSVDVHVDLAFDENTKSTTQTIRIPYWTEDGTATAGEDFKSTRGELVVTPGTSTAKINVEVLNDKMKEAEETFRVVLGNPTSPSGATVKRGTGTVTIKSDDTYSPATPTISVAGPAKGAGYATITGKVDANAQVELWGAPIAGNGELKWLVNGKADGNGNYKFSRSIATGYRFAVQSQEMNSAERAVKVTQNPAFSVSSTKGKVTVSVTGNPKASGQAVVVQKLVKGKWSTAYKGTTTGAGFKKTYSVKSKTKLTLRAFVAGNTSAGLNGGYSASKNITIK
ncbi:Calx-beta domain-containing protein [Actinoplanes sp. GCM10030250]|uniref:Calx-beta domain-containing protein n=1 Tax=Actinoplanes sp. GCM10030250 TaxID=3273376 RepID=UPI0036092CDD